MSTLFLRISIALVVAVIVSGFYAGAQHDTLYFVDLATMASFAVATVITALLAGLNSTQGAAPAIHATSHTPAPQKAPAPKAAAAEKPAAAPATNFSSLPRDKAKSLGYVEPLHGAGFTRQRREVCCGRGGRLFGGSCLGCRRLLWCRCL